MEKWRFDGIRNKLLVFRVIEIEAQMFHEQIRSEAVTEVGRSEWLAIHRRLDFVFIIEHNNAYELVCEQIHWPNLADALTNLRISVANKAAIINVCRGNNRYAVVDYDNNISD